MDVEFWVVIDIYGEMGFGTDLDSATSSYDDVGTDAPRRALKITLKNAVPTVVELSATLPDEAGTVEMEVKDVAE